MAADGVSFDEAVNEMIDALREYAEDWQQHLLDAPNLRDNWGLVHLISFSDDCVAGLSCLTVTSGSPSPNARPLVGRAFAV